MADFQNAMLQAGIEPPQIIPADGALHRFHIAGDKPRTENGWFILHDDPPAGAFGCWKRGISETWSAREHRTMTPAEKSKLVANMEAVKRHREAEQEKIHTDAREKASRIWAQSQPAPADHPYLVAKGIKPHGLRESKGALVVPLRDTAGTLHGLQFIDGSGGKKFLTGTAKAGNYFSIGKPDGVLCLAEGFATAASIHESTGHAVAVAFDAGNLQAVLPCLKEKFPELQIIVCGDNDASGTGQRAAEEAALAVGGFVALPPVTGQDFNDLHNQRGADAVRKVIAAAMVVAPEQQQESPAEAKPEGRIRVIEAIDFMRTVFPPRDYIFSPWLPRQGLAMVYAPRGIGKTHFSLGVAYAVASGGNFLSWNAPTPLGVLFIDGEMPGAVLKERLARIAASNEKEPSAPLRIITPDLQPESMIDLSKPLDQKELAPYLNDVALIVVDNLSTLCRGGKESEGEGWLPVQEWALAQRAAGRSVLFIHHAGKNGEQRGTSRREDVLDTVIALRRPGDYAPEKGACFEVHFEKARGVYGDETKPFEAQLFTTENGEQEWTVKPLEQSTVEKVAAALNDGVPQHEIAEMLSIAKSTVSKARKKAQQQGLLIGVS